jgi:hypothetical protein
MNCRLEGYLTHLGQTYKKKLVVLISELSGPGTLFSILDKLRCFDLVQSYVGENNVIVIDVDDAKSAIKYLK